MPEIGDQRSEIGMPNLRQNSAEGMRRRRRLRRQDPETRFLEPTPLRKIRIGIAAAMPDA